MSVDESIVDLLESKYGIVNPEFVSQHWGTQSTIWRFRTPGGDIGLRRSRPMAYARLQYCLRVVRALEAAGIPVTAPVETASGELLCRHDGGKYVAYRWLEGETAETVSLTADDARFLGGVLGRVHLALADYRGDCPVPARRYQQVSDALAKIDELLELLASKDEMDATDLLIKGDLEYKRAELVRRGGPPDAVIALYERGRLLHGDFHAGNILYDVTGSRFAGLIDLESFHHGPRVWDIAKACMFTFGARAEHCVEFVSGYHQANPLTPEEIDAFYPLSVDYMLKSNWGYEEYLIKHNPHIKITDTLTVECAKRLIADQASYDDLSRRIMGGG